MKPMCITFTGADREDLIPDMVKLSKIYPVEWGILFSPANQGKKPRYPAPSMITRLFDKHLMLSAHLCGKHSRDVMAGKEPDLPVSLQFFKRIQVNSREPNVEKILALPNPGQRCIAQTRGEFSMDDRIWWLYDCSGGRGEMPKRWPSHPGEGRLVGFAGGLRPDNVEDALKAIEPTEPYSPYWIDMESGVRSPDNVFDINLCREVCERVYG